MRKQLFALAALVLSAAATHAAPIAATVSTDGNGYQGELSLLNDGRSVAAVGWNGLGKVFTFEFDDLYRIDNVSLAVRRGGDYRLEFSTDAKEWGRLLTVPGVVTDGGSGIATVSTDPADADYVRELLFAPAEARYVRISADKASGDKTEGGKDAPLQYAIAEVAFSEWTRDGKLRHPRFLGLRRDKKARDVTRERPAR